jgi:hypothetical protein
MVFLDNAQDLGQTPPGLMGYPPCGGPLFPSHHQSISSEVSFYHAITNYIFTISQLDKCNGLPLQCSRPWADTPRLDGDAEAPSSPLAPSHHQSISSEVSFTGLLEPLVPTSG